MCAWHTVARDGFGDAIILSPTVSFQRTRADPAGNRYTSGMSSRIPRAAVALRWSLLAGLLMLPGCTVPGRTDLDTAQALVEIGESFNEVRSAQAELQDRIDSLVSVVTRQDSTIRTLANLAGVSLPAR